MATVDLESGSAPLTVLSEDETMFRDAVREFAETEVRAARAPDGRGAADGPGSDPAASSSWGSWAIEVPEELGGTGSSFFTAALVVEELSARRPQRGRAGGRAEHAGQQRLPPLGLGGAQAEVPAAARQREGRRLRALRGRLRLRRLRARHPRGAGGRRLPPDRPKLWITNGAEAEIFIVFANVEPGRRLQGDHRLHRREGVRRLLGREEGGQAGDPRLVHHRAGAGGCVRPGGERARRGRAGVQDGDRDAQRGADRDRRADDRHRRRARWTRP